MKERLKFVMAHEEEFDVHGRVNMTALCEAYGVSRPTGYKWLERFRKAGEQVSALEDASRRPLSSPTATSEEWVELVLAARRLHPRWGARKLHAWLRRQVAKKRGLRLRAPLVKMPQPSTISAILHRHGLIRRYRKRSRIPVRTKPFAACRRSNDTWCVDFKGQFRTGDGARVYPLTIMDAHSRFLIRCELVLDPDARSVIPIFESAFREFGLPKAIRSDNGPPFASKAPGGLTTLSAWWARLGISHERITPGKPQENGRHERMHLTLKQETAMPPASSPKTQQQRFDLFRKDYNEERPHEALDQDVPADRYRRSTRPLPGSVPQIEYPLFWETRRVRKSGRAMLFRSGVHVGPALVGELVGFEWVADRRWLVRYGKVLLGLFDEGNPKRGLVRVKKQLDPSSTIAIPKTSDRGEGERGTRPNKLRDSV
ncbi:MAG: DDE-type integrase/transposase/recombinase [Myxococcota bacterium]